MKNQEQGANDDKELVTVKNEEERGERGGCQTKTTTFSNVHYYH